MLLYSRYRSPPQTSTVCYQTIQMMIVSGNEIHFDNNFVSKEKFFINISFPKQIDKRCKFKFSRTRFGVLTCLIFRSFLHGLFPIIIMNFTLKSSIRSSSRIKLLYHIVYGTQVLQVYTVLCVATGDCGNRSSNSLDRHKMFLTYLIYFL